MVQIFLNSNVKLQKKGNILSPSKLIQLFIVSLGLSSFISSYMGIKTPLLFLNENQIFYLYSTSAQVLAGIYGLTLTGFIFFRNELSREEFEDDTLTEAIDNLKSRYYTILVFITIITIFTLLMSNIVISAEHGNNSKLTIILMNITQSSFVINLLAIAYFIFDIIAPKRIAKESKNIRQAVDPLEDSSKQGSLEEFLSNYNKLEYIIQKYGQAYQSEFENNTHKSRRRISNIRLVEFILRAEKIDYQFFEEIKNLISLRNSIIHGADPIVSQNIVETSSIILKKLADALNVTI